MQILREGMYVLTKAEYDHITDPTKSYVPITKEEAVRIVDRIIEETGYPCGEGECYCYGCPIHKLLDTPATYRLCQRVQSWPK